MKKAIFFSLLIHALIMLSLWMFLPEVQVRDKFLPVAVFLIPPPPETPVAAAEPEKPVPQIPKILRTSPEEPEVRPEIRAVPPPKTLQNVPQNGDPSTGEDVPISTDTKVSEPVIVEDGKLPAVEEISDPSDLYNDENSGNFPEDTINSPGIENVLDISWTDGRERALLNGEDPVLAISRNMLLMDQVHIEFSVQQDGTVSSVIVRNPGSGDLRVDRQLREWALLLRFDPVSGDRTADSGIITINLIARESPSR